MLKTKKVWIRILAIALGVTMLFPAQVSYAAATESNVVPEMAGEAVLESETTSAARAAKSLVSASDGQPEDDGRIYVEGNLYNGYYKDNAGLLYIVSNGTPKLYTGVVSASAKYYYASKVRKFAKKTLYVKGRKYSGYYLDRKNKMYYAKKGLLKLKTGIVPAKTKYYSGKANKTRKLNKQTLYVKGKLYSGYYLDKKNKMHYTKKGSLTLKTGVVSAKTKYYSGRANKTRKLKKQTLYVKGKLYTGYFLNSKNTMYSAQKGVITTVSTVLDSGTKYYSYKEKKTRRLSKQTLYVKGKLYTGYYLDGENMMYSVQKGICTIVNTPLAAGTAYYNYNTGTMCSLQGQTFYINGKALEGMSAESMATLQRAQAVVAGITNDSMTREQKLRVCFDYVKAAYPEIKPRIPHYTGMDWPVIYANDMFVRGAGNCCSYAAAFAYMAKAIGYDEVYCCNSGGHGWAEIDGLVYDPEWSKWHHVYNYYALSYDTKTDQDYKGAIGARKPWMRIKI